MTEFETIIAVWLCHAKTVPETTGIALLVGSGKSGQIPIIRIGKETRLRTATPIDWMPERRWEFRKCPEWGH